VGWKQDAGAGEAVFQGEPTIAYFSLVLKNSLSLEVEHRPIRKSVEIFRQARMRNPQPEKELVIRRRQ
jgi:hypothetical protein